MRWIKGVIISVLFLLSAIRAAPIPLADDEDDPSRLPKNSRPIRYDITLSTNVHTSDRAFDGFVIIDIEITADTDTITLHNRGLTPINSRLWGNGVDDITHTISSDPTRDFVFITTTQQVLQVGEFYSIEIAYTGQLDLNMNGFYRSSYRIGNETRFLASTQFESTGARQAFFSYDEPEFKAVFKLAITHVSTYSAISNTLGTTVDNGNGTSTTSFETSPIMPTYLLAFVVSDFGYSTNEASLPSGEIIQRVYARPDEIARTEYALDQSIKFLKQLEYWAKYTYELPKMFSAAIPDFAAGAMENWGLITYKEQYLILEETSHPRERFDSMRVIAHEIGHQFFGNVVTCKWWNFIWLNEGFATVFEYLLVELEYPELRMRDLFNVIKVQGAFRPDSLESSHPMTFDGQTQSLIIYDKAGSVIRMFQYAVGDDLFRDAMNYYLDYNNHKPVTSDDLYWAVDVVLEQSNFTEFNFTDAFKTWENQKGYPVVNVIADDSSSVFRVTQQRYLALTEKTNETDGSSWYIPLNYATESSPNFEDITITSYFLDDQSDTTISYPAAFTSSQWFIFNKQQIGYYRVNYDANNWQQLISILNSDNFNDVHVSNRAQLVDDALNFATDEYLDYETAFGILSYLEREIDYVPWRAAITNLDKLDYLIQGRPSYGNFQRFVRKLVRLMYVTYGLEEREGDTLLHQYARELAIDWTCRMADEGCLRETYSYLRKITLEDLQVPKSLEISYICNGLKGQNREEEFIILWNRMLASNDQSERIRIIDGLLCSSDPNTLRDLLISTLDSTDEYSYRSHEIQRIWGNILSRSSVGIEMMIDFIEEFYDEIRAMSRSQVDSTISALSQRIGRSVDQQKLTELMDRLVERSTDPLNVQTRTNALRNIEINNNWIASEKFSQATGFVDRIIGAIDDAENQMILPKTSEPRHYKIHITATNIPTGDRSFSGEIEIDALVKESTDRIMIHSREQTILDVQVFYKNEMTAIPVYNYNTLAAAHMLTIYFFDEIPANSEVIMLIKYSAIMQTAQTNYGFHITSYVHEEETRYLGVTQFESSLGSRFAFPHYDEPRYKAQFELTLTHSDRHHAISNTFGTATNNGDGTVTTTFEQTPTMSSYLLAFVISDLESVTNEDTKAENDTLQRVWVRPDSVSKAWFALQSSDNVLKALEEYLDFEFELPKMDSAGIPNKNGAMENWGMITYWESAMIYQEEYADITHALKLSGVDVIAHEEAHQFFGNVATFEWWDYLWLSEGFATLFEYQITGTLYPSWNMRSFFNIRELHNAFRYDSGSNVRSMTPTPSLLTPAEIRSSFDTIAYDKSGSVIRMFQNAVGEEIFKAALKQYLTDNNQKSVIPQNLFDAFQTAMDSAQFTAFDFATTFKTWELQRGYPIIHVRYDATGQFEIAQERYFTQKPATSNDTSNWYIPLNFATQLEPYFDNTTITFYFDNGLPSITIPAPTSFDINQWFIFNKQQLGYYRVNYDLENWHAIILALNSADFDKIHVLNRVQLIDDAVNFAAGDYISYDVLFGLLQYLSRETEYTPWFSADRFITQLYTAFGPFNVDLNLFVRHLSKRFYDSFKLDADGVIPLEEVYERYGRELATKLACNAGNENCLDDTFNVLKQFIENDRPIPKGLETVIWCSSFRGANKYAESVEMWNRMLTSSDTAFKSQIISALGCSSNSTLLKDYLESTVATTNSYTQTERRNILSAVLNSDVGLQAVINFMRDFEASIISSFSYTLEELISIPARTVKTRAQQALFNAYLQSVTDLPEASATRIYAILENNFLAQETSFYPVVMAMIQKISENQLRLPTTSEPRHYRLHLDARNIPSGDRAFTGEIETHIVINESTDRIIMHSKTQVIDELRVFEIDGTTEVEVIEHHLYPETDTLTIYFMNYLVPNDELIVRIKYTTDLVLSATGFYQTSYVINGEQRFLGATQFESTGGRYAFPHYDEPGYKAVFDFSITHDTIHKAIANTFGDTVENADGTATTTFEPSPIMSSYLLAFVVSDLESVNNTETIQQGETLHRVWVRPDSLAKAWYAVEVSDKILKALEEYVDFAYEIPKVDSAGVPNKGGAMENWGMVTYRENAMIYEEIYEDISHTQKLSGVDVIAHELAHQFFGNTVTCEWWDYIWLNEGFATVFEYHLTGMIYPEWRVVDLFNIRTLQNVFRNDARVETRAMTKVLLTPAEISGAFDYVVYAKAGSVLRMFQYAVGEDVFRAALKLYLETNNHKPVNSQHLVDAFTEEMASHGFTDFDFDLAFRTWELQRGYPVIHVSYSDAREFDITQQRFFTQRNQSIGDTSSFYIPLNFATASNPNFDDTKITNYFVNGQDRFVIDVPTDFNASQWFVFNKQQLGYYRVNYDLQNWNALANVLNSDGFNQIHVLNRAQLIDDSLSFAEGDYLSSDVLFSLLQYLSRETVYTPWFPADRFITQLYTVFGPFNVDLNLFVRHLSKRFYDSFKLDADGVIPFEELYERFGRELATKLACNAGNENCLDDTFNVLKQFIENDRPIPKGLETVIWCSSFRGANKYAESVEMWNRMLTSSDTAFKSQIISALGCSSNSTLLKDYLESTVATTNSYTQTERRNILSAVLNSDVGLQAVINFMRDFEASIISSFSYTLEELISVPARTVKTRAQQALFNAYLQSVTDLPVASATRIYAILENNFLAQETSFYPVVMAMIQKISENQLRLPTTSEPRHYRLHLDARNIPSGDRAFTGEIETHIVINESTDRIIMHSKTQVIDELRVFEIDGTTEVEVIEHHLYPETDTLTIYFMNYLVPNDELIVRIKYTTDLVLSATGFYQTSYVINGEQRFLGATQFESTGGRYAFPHYDEPGYKAVFDFSITHDTIHKAIANTFGDTVENADGTATTTFEPSPIMSSYLLAFVVSDLESVNNTETIQQGETLHRVWVRPDSLAKAWYAVEVSDKILKALEEYVDFAYEIPKVDSAGVPNKGGAMENWGMVTYRENAMIYEEIYEDISHTQKLSGVDVIAHELAHQFFGNTVTCEWWDYIWLNEGFATVFEYHLTGMIYPEWRVVDLFNIRTLQNVFRNDARVETRAMTKALLTPAEISGAFDYVVYAKAGSVLRMFQYAVGEDVFRAALKLYLETNNHKPVNSQHLVDAFTEEMASHGFTDFDFDVAFRTWELQRGYPVIHVSYSDAREFDITQQRFFTQRNQSIGDTSSFYIPLNFATASNPNFDDTNITNYFVNGQDRFVIDVPTDFNDSQWFVFNKQQLGYYRVNYDLQNWNALANVLNSDGFNQIHVLNRAQLIDDSLSFAEGDYLSSDVLFSLLQYLSRETVYTPWFPADRFITQLYTVFGPFNVDLNLFVRHLSKRFYDSFKLDADGVIPFEELYERFGRELATKLACNAGNENCLDDTFNVLKQFIENDRPIPKGLETVIWCSSFRGANKYAESVEMWNRMLTSSDTAFKSQIISALGCSSNSTLLKDYLESTVATTNSYTQTERRNILSAVLNSDVGLQAVINFMRDFEASIISSFSYTLEELISVPARTVKTRAQQALFNAYLQSVTDLPVASATRIYAILENNFLAQETSFYPVVMAMIQKISENQLRLPTTSEPRHYRLHLDARNIPSGDRAFTGEIETHVVINESTDRIIMHSKTQVIDELRVFEIDGTTEVEVIEHHLYPETDTLTIYFMNYLVPNDELIVRIKYTTDLVLSATGFYQTSYVINGEQRFLGATQFESTGGRYAFPHYDEPGYKAVFDFSITHDTIHKAIANTFGDTVENADGTATTTFEPSPIMSSYLLAFVVSDLESVNNTETIQQGETLHRVWVRPDSLAKAWYAVEVSDKILKALEEYVDFAYEIPKVDSAGVPNKGGAMENWGMVTYRENAMIYEEIYEDISHTQKLSGVDVIAHELAHQFFGNTVTCEWWDYIWLNEGFATVFEYHLTGMIYPEWRVVDLFNIRTLQNVFRNDARVETRAMTKALLTPAEISGAFDYVVYAKAGSVLRMFQYAVGEDVFRAALKLYLETNNHKPVNSQHLVDAFTEEMASHGFTDFDFDLAFRTWELQRGYPVIHVSYSDAREFDITQQRFFTQRNQSIGDLSSFYIPLNFATASNPNFNDTNITNYFVNGQDRFVIDVPTNFDASQWFVFNKQQLGYYRVNYDLQNWNALANVLNSDGFNQIHVLNRAQLIDDSLSFAEGDYLSYDVLLNLLPYLSRESEYTPWYSADRFITSLYTAFGSHNSDLNEFVRILSEHFYDTFLVPDDGYIPFEELFERFSRELALKLACNSGNERCLSDTFNVNKHLIEDNHPIPKGLEGVVMCSGFRGTGKQTQWNELLRMTQVTTDATFKSQAINALGCSDDPDSLKLYLESTIDEDNNFNYTQTERRNVLNAVLNSHSGLSAVINFIRDFESEIVRLFGYATLEDILNVPALTIKISEHETTFVDFVQTLTHLEPISSSRIAAIITNNFQVQQQTPYAESLAFIRRYLDDQQETTVQTPTPTPTSTPSPTPTPTTDEPEEPTTTEASTDEPSGASFMKIQITTLFVSLFIILAFKI